MVPIDKAVVNSGDGCSGSLGGGHTPSDNGHKLHFHNRESFVKMDLKTKQ